ncbi:MAG: hypothetical protein AB7F78_21150 [Hyphomicrobiaceae bacterium]
MSKIEKRDEIEGVRPLSGSEMEQVGGAGWSVVNHNGHHDLVLKVWGVTVARIHLPW